MSPSHRVGTEVRSWDGVEVAPTTDKPGDAEHVIEVIQLSYDRAADVCYRRRPDRVS
jgi:hypothetical protein